MFNAAYKLFLTTKKKKNPNFTAVGNNKKRIYIREYVDECTLIF